MKFERHQNIEGTQYFGVVKFQIMKSLKVTKETIRSDPMNLPDRDIPLSRHGGAFILILDNAPQNEIAYAGKNMNQRRNKKVSAMKNNVCVIGSFNVDIIISYLPRQSTGESLLAVIQFIFFTRR